MYLNLEDFNLSKADPVVQELFRVLVGTLYETFQDDLPELAKQLNRQVESLRPYLCHKLDCEQLEVLRSYCKSIAGPPPS